MGDFGIGANIPNRSVEPGAVRKDSMFLINVNCKAVFDFSGYAASATGLKFIVDFYIIREKQGYGDVQLPSNWDTFNKLKNEGGVVKRHRRKIGQAAVGLYGGVYMAQQRDRQFVYFNQNIRVNKEIKFQHSTDETTGKNNNLVNPIDQIHIWYIIRQKDPNTTSPALSIPCKFKYTFNYRLD